MKMRTKKLTTLFVAAAMSVSALPFASIGANAEDAGGSPYTMYIATKDTKDARQRTVTISKDDLAKGDYTFRAAIYIDNPDLGLSSTADWPTTVQALWAPYDANGNDAWNDIHFSNQTAMTAQVAQYTEPVTGISATYPMFCLAPLGRKGTYDDVMGQEFYSAKGGEEDAVDGNLIYADGKGGCYFTRTYFKSAADKAAGNATTEKVTPTVTVDANNVATLTWTNIDKSTFAPVEVSMTVVNWDKTLPADTMIPGKNNSHNWSYTNTKQTTFKGDSSDALHMFDFDVTVDADTAEGTYYVGFDNTHETTIVTNGFKSYWPDNLNFTYKKVGETMVIDKADKNEKEYWLKIVVGDGSAAPATTTPAPATTTKAPEVTTTPAPATTTKTPEGNTPSTPNVEVTDYAWLAGEYYVAPGDEIQIAPTVKNADKLNAEGVAAWGFDFEDDLYVNGVLTGGDYEKGTAYNGIPGIMPNYEELHFVATASDDSLFKANDGDELLNIYYIIGDESAVKAAAAKMGAKAVEKDGKTYYAFPLKFDNSAPGEHDDIKCVVKIGEGPTGYDGLQLVDGTIYVQIDGLKVEEPTPGTTITTTTPAPTTTTTTVTTTKAPTPGTTTPAPATTTKAPTPGTTTAPVNPGDLTPFYGDINLDGAVSVIDVILLNKAAAGNLILNAQQKLNGDCNQANSGAGKIDTSDVDALMKFIVELVDTLPVK